MNEDPTETAILATADLEVHLGCLGLKLLPLNLQRGYFLLYGSHLSLVLAHELKSLPTTHS